MESLLYNISQVLGITIIHSLWQGLLIFFVLRLIFSAAPALSSVKKYNLSAVALLGMAVWFIYTFCAEANAYDWSPVAATYSLTNGFNLHAVAHPDLQTTLYTSIKNYLPLVSVIYAIGLVVNLSRLGFAWNKIRLIKKSMIAAENLQPRIDEFSHRLNISRYVKVSFSRLVDVPCVIGYFKPILLLPITLTFQLSAEEIETIILHELSHIKGNDFLVNLVQQLISVLLFFNPFAQLINNIMSTERENRCDDMVVEKTQNKLTYAYALLKLEEVRQGELKLALAATQNKNHLLNRIERIMETKTPIGNIRPILFAVLLIAGSLGSIAWLNPEIKNGKIILKNRIAAPATARIVSVAEPAVTVVPELKHKHKITLVNDTSRLNQLDTNKKKIKIVVVDEKGNTKEYNSVSEMPESVREDFYKDNSKFSNNMFMNYKFSDSSLFSKKQLAELTANAKAMSKRFNSPEFKKQMEKMQLDGKKMSEEMQKRFSDPKYKKQFEDMQLNAKKMSEDMQKRFSDPKFKKQMEDMKLNGQKMKEEMEKRMNDPEWKKQMEDMKNQGAEMEKFYSSPEWKKQVDEMAKQGEEMGKYYNSDEWKKQAEEFAKQGAEMGKYYSSAEWKKVQDELVKNAEEMSKNMKDMKFDFNYDYNNTNKEKAERKETKPTAKSKAGIKADVKEKKEVKEKPEKKEAKEKAEKKVAEKPEKKEAPEKPEN